MELKIFTEIQMAQLNIKAGSRGKNEEIEVTTWNGSITQNTIVLLKPSAQEQSNYRNNTAKNSKGQIT